MSAYMCDACHLTALAAYAVKHRLTTDGVVPTYRVLARENDASLRYRYPKADEMRDHGEPACEWAMERGLDDAFTPNEILKAAHCYGYQACEHPDWKGSEARRLIAAIAERALRTGARENSPGYDEATWGITCKHPAPPVAPPTPGRSLRPLTEAECAFLVTIEPNEDWEPDFDDPEAMAEIARRRAAGETEAWCTVTVHAQWNGFKASACLGGCSIGGTELASDYARGEGLFSEALANLNDDLEARYARLATLVTP